jgi:hypothetical protein
LFVKHSKFRDFLAIGYEGHAVPIIRKCTEPTELEMEVKDKSYEIELYLFFVERKISLLLCPKTHKFL